MNKLFCIIFVLFILFLIQNNCNKEGFLSIKTKFNKCKDDKEWYVKNKKGKHYCAHIGKSVSCYDRDAIGREGWERCLKSCGNCVNSKITKVPMDNLAGFSGDPYEDFGVVLNIDTDRQWVGKTASNDKNDIRGFVMDKKRGEDILNLKNRVESVESIFDILTGNIISCSDTSGTSCKIGRENGYYNCDGTTCLKCPKKNDKINKKIHNYIKKDGDSIIFPANQISCNNLTNFFKKKNEIINNETCKKYILFDQISKSDKDIKSDKKMTLADICPNKCGNSICGGSKSTSASKPKSTSPSTPDSTSPSTPDSTLDSTLDSINNDINKMDELFGTNLSGTIDVNLDGPLTDIDVKL